MPKSEVAYEEEMTVFLFRSFFSFLISIHLGFICRVEKRGEGTRPSILLSQPGEWRPIYTMGKIKVLSYVQNVNYGAAWTGLKEEGPSLSRELEFPEWTSLSCTYSYVCYLSRLLYLPTTVQVVLLYT